LDSDIHFFIEADLPDEYFGESNPT